MANESKGKTLPTVDVGNVMPEVQAKVADRMAAARAGRGRRFIADISDEQKFNVRQLRQVATLARSIAKSIESGSTKYDGKMQSVASRLASLANAIG